MSENKEIWTIAPLDLGELIKAKYKGRRTSILIKGAIGIGKSSLVRQVSEEIAKELGLQFICLNEIFDDEAYEIYKDMLARLKANQPPKYFIFWSVPLPSIDVVDFLGSLKDTEEYVTWKPPIKIKLLQRARHGIIFLDELNVVEDKTVKHLAQRLLLDKEIGGIINRNIMVISACNRAVDTEQIEILGSRDKNRVLIVEMQPFTVEQFTLYMRRKHGNKFDYRVCAFLQRNPEYFVTLDENEEELENFATPRSWEDCGCTLYDARDLDLENQIARGCLGKDVAIKFLAFLKLKPIPPKELIQRPEMISTVKPEVQLYSVITLADAINREFIKLEEAQKFINYIVQNDRSLLMMFWIALDRKFTRQIMEQITWDDEMWKYIEKMEKYL
ncbi:MAG TPA: ATP-binding protein [Archaeoglobus sp.]|nr:ATP-binding protein [Archaeoglobus sp.]